MSYPSLWPSHAGARDISNIRAGAVDWNQPIIGMLRRRAHRLLIASGIKNGNGGSARHVTAGIIFMLAGLPGIANGQAALANLSVRAQIARADAPLINGFIISGPANKTVIVRAIGPSLTSAGVSGALPDPTLEIHNSSGAVIATNDNWRDSQQQLFAAGGEYHTFQPGSDREPAIAMTLPAGSYTAVVRGKNGSAGLVLAELYDGSPKSDSQLVNLSARALVQRGDEVMIGGLIIGTGGFSDIVVRALGPSLAASGVTNVLADPTLLIYDANGTLLRADDNWADTAAQATQLMSLALAPPSPLDAAIPLTLPSGAYTAIVSGKNGGSGVALLETYKIANGPSAIPTNTYAYRAVCPSPNGGREIYDKWSFWQCECTSYAADKLNERGIPFWFDYKGGRWGSASTWINAANRAGVHYDTMPRQGDVAWWSFGHVAYVNAVDAYGNVRISEYNWNWNRDYNTRILKRGGGAYPTYFIHL